MKGNLYLGGGGSKYHIHLGAGREKNRWFSCEVCNQVWCFSFSVSLPADKTAKAEAQPAPDGTQLPPGHPAPAPSQGAASKCPFLAAQMGQQGSSVFRKASLELQEDVQEMHAVRKGTTWQEPGRGRSPLGPVGPSDLFTSYYWGSCVNTFLF